MKRSKVYGGEDRFHPAAGRGRDGGRGGLQQGRISDATFYNWKKRYGDLTPSEVKRIRQLENENNRLKKIVADLTLDKTMLQDVVRRKL